MLQSKPEKFASDHTPLARLPHFSATLEIENTMKLWTIALAACLAVATMHADAARIGGGRSVGKQSSNVTQRQATPDAAPKQAAPANQAAPTAAPAAAAARKPWGGMLAGLAAGLGLAWLASSLGLGEEFGQFIMIALGVLVLMMAVGWFMRSRQAAQRQGAGGLAFQGAGPASGMPSSYNPENVGNDSSARPWERSTSSFNDTRVGPQGGSMIGSGIRSSGQWSIPADFDVESFVSAAKANFVTMQGAWDRSDLSALRAMMTNDMLDEIRVQLAEREAHSGGVPNNTEVVMLDGKLLGIEDLGQDYMASVEFSGIVRENPSSGPSPFREVWNMTKPKDGRSGWLVAGVQALQ